MSLAGAVYEATGDDASVGRMCDLDAEAIVLCALLTHEEMIDLIRAQLEPGDFMSRPNRTIYEAIIALRDGNADPTPSAIWAWLDTNGRMGDFLLGESRAVGLAYLARLIDNIPDYSRKIDPFITRLLDKARLRKTQFIAGQVRASSAHYKGDVQAFIDRAVEALRSVADRRDMMSMVHVSDVLRETFALWQLVKEGRTANGIATGFPLLDKMLGGLRPETLNILAARPGVGKSAYALNLATAVSGFGGGVAFFSLEMSRSELTNRQLATLASVPLGIISAPEIMSDGDSARLAGAADVLQRRPIWIDDNGKTGLHEIRAKSKRVDNELRRKGGALQLIVVDYVGLMAEPDGARNREQAIAHNSRGLKVLAKEMKIPVLLLCQMNRDVEKRSGEPRLSDLRESGSLEQDADAVMFLHRDMANSASEATLILAKNRSGPQGRINLTYHAAFTRFVEAQNQDGV